MVQPLWKTVQRVSYKTRHTLIYHLATLFFDIYPNELKPDVSTKTHTQMLIAPVHYCQNWEATKISFNCGLCKESLVLPHNGKLFSNEKEVSHPSQRHGEAKCILQSVRSRAEKTNCYMTLWNSGKDEKTVKFFYEFRKGRRNEKVGTEDF